MQKPLWEILGSSALSAILALHQHNYTSATLRGYSLVWQKPFRTALNPKTGMPFYHGGVQDNAHVRVRVPP